MRRADHFWISPKEVRAASIASPGSGLMANGVNCHKNTGNLFFKSMFDRLVARYKTPPLLRCLRVALERLSRRMTPSEVARFTSQLESGPPRPRLRFSPTSMNSRAHENPRAHNLAGYFSMLLHSALLCPERTIIKQSPLPPPPRARTKIASICKRMYFCFLTL